VKVRTLWQLVKWLALALAVLVLLLLAPIGYIELFCRAKPEQQAFKPIITDPAWQRVEANSYLTYPEWHIVYAYQGLAEVLRNDDEHAFPYTASVTGFWRSACELNRVANRHGGGDFATRATMYTIGVSFTVEMAMKALYEETIGRVFALLRGQAKTPQDAFAAAMAADYGSFLQQTPWYDYDFENAVVRLWAEPLGDPLRGWERRLALGGEWKAKAGYAGLIKDLVSATTGEANLRLRSVVSGIDPTVLDAIEGVDIVSQSPEGVLIESPRYAAFREIAKQIAAAGGSFVEIAGNDDIMLTAVSAKSSIAVPENSLLIATVSSTGFGDWRHLISVPVAEISNVIRAMSSGEVKLEHIHDY
jgi:hypothetical protein